MGTPDAAHPGRDTSHRGTWFRLPGRSRWHSEAHREYGVLWSLCGVRVVGHEAESKGTLDENDIPCGRCAEALKK